MAHDVPSDIYQSIERGSLHLTQPVRESTQVVERNLAGTTHENGSSTRYFDETCQFMAHDVPSDIYQSIELEILHLTQPVRDSTQVVERIRAGTTHENGCSTRYFDETCQFMAHDVPSDIYQSIEREILNLTQPVRDSTQV